MRSQYTRSHKNKKNLKGKKNHDYESRIPSLKKNLKTKMNRRSWMKAKQNHCFLMMKSLKNQEYQCLNLKTKELIDIYDTLLNFCHKDNKQQYEKQNQIHKNKVTKK